VSAPASAAIALNPHPAPIERFNLQRSSPAARPSYLDTHAQRAVAAGRQSPRRFKPGRPGGSGDMLSPFSFHPIGAIRPAGQPRGSVNRRSSDDTFARTRWMPRRAWPPGGSRPGRVRCSSAGDAGESVWRSGDDLGSC